MFRQNVINVTALLVVYLLIGFSCNVVRHELIDVYRMPVVIKFTIPDSSIIFIESDFDQKNKVINSVKKYYPKVVKLKLVHDKRIDGIYYYEFSGISNQKKVTIFVFLEDGIYNIKGFESIDLPDIETRYTLNENGLAFYKKIIIAKQTRTVNVNYHLMSKSISFCLDDGFSLW